MCMWFCLTLRSCREKQNDACMLDCFGALLKRQAAKEHLALRQPCQPWVILSRVQDKKGQDKKGQDNCSSRRFPFVRDVAVLER